MAASPEPLRPSAPLDRWGSGYEAGCAGKLAYPTENAARAGLALLERLGTVRSGSGFDLYRCRYCREWHFGHTGRAGKGA